MTQALQPDEHLVDLVLLRPAMQRLGTAGMAVLDARYEQALQHVGAYASTDPQACMLLLIDLASHFFEALEQHASTDDVDQAIDDWMSRHS